MRNRWERSLLASLPEKEPCSLALEGAQLGGPAQSLEARDSSIFSIAMPRPFTPPPLVCHLGPRARHFLCCLFLDARTVAS